jgi:hypothetical protein
VFSLEGILTTPTGCDTQQPHENARAFGLLHRGLELLGEARLLRACGSALKLKSKNEAVADSKNLQCELQVLWGAVKFPSCLRTQPGLIEKSRLLSGIVDLFASKGYGDVPLSQCLPTWERFE